MRDLLSPHWRTWLARVAASDQRAQLAPAVADRILSYVESLEEQLDEQRKERIRHATIQAIYEDRT